MNIHAIMTPDKIFLSIQNEIPSGIQIVVVSKFQENENILSVYNVGHKIFGENKVQEIIRKREMLPQDIQWHMIGHLQTNKIKYIAPFISMIHSVDSLKLLQEINKQAAKHNRIIECLLQFYIATEESKFGLDINEAKALLSSTDFANLNNIAICGVMGMASFSDDMQLVRKEFKSLKHSFEVLKKEYFNNDDTFKHISMGMTQDYHIAIEEGSTMLRIGSAIFHQNN
jgi:PLP dependent protein